MNEEQKRVILGAIVAVVFISLFPHWSYTTTFPQCGKVLRPAGYQWVFSPPKPQEGEFPCGIEMDTTRLFVQVGIVALVATGLLLFFKDRAER